VGPSKIAPGGAGLGRWFGERNERDWAGTALQGDSRICWVLPVWNLTMNKCHKSYGAMNPPRIGLFRVRCGFPVKSAHPKTRGDPPFPVSKGRERTGRDAA
jgi:hypothetical protein